MKINTLEQVVQYQLCCGCGLCAYLHPNEIQMVDAPAYGRRPRFSMTTKDDSTFYQLALELCPGFGVAHTLETSCQTGQIESLANYWGPVLKIWEGYAADPEIRWQGSSGGAMTAIALYSLEREGMHGVLHTSVDEKKPYLNKTVMSRNRNALLEAAGSRYSPASPCDGLQLIEKATSPCVFIGKPCDVVAAQKARRQRPALHANIGLTMACFCAGTPSTNGTLEMLRQMGCPTPNELSSLHYRGRGWPGTAMATISKNGTTIRSELSYEQSWGHILEKYRQWRCYLCPDHTGEFADIASGDPWYMQKSPDDPGRSLIIARSVYGQGIIEKAISAGFLTAEEVGPDRLPASQPNLLKSRGRLWGQLVTLKALNAPTPSIRGFKLFFAWRNCLNLKEKIQSILGTTKRIHKKKIKTKIHVMFENN